ncbi:MAG: arginase family protein [Pseudonocardia sp.]
MTPVPNVGFETITRAGGPHLLHPREGTLVRLTPQVQAALADPTGAAPRLHRIRLLVPEADGALAAGGVARRSAVPLGPSWHLTRPGRGWVVIGCAYAAGFRPEANPTSGALLLRTGLARRLDLAAPSAWSWTSRRTLSAAELAVRDYGDVLHDDATDTAATVHARLAFAARQVCDEGSRPLVLGGDHSVAHPVVGAVARATPGLRLVHLDAHADRAPRTGAPAAQCGDVVTRLLDSHPDLRVLTLGVRGVDSRFADDGTGRVEYVTAAELRRGDGTARLRRFVTGHRVHVSLDADVLDPAFAPEVAYPVPGGLDMGELQDVLASVACEGEVVGADVTEVCGGTGVNRAASALTQAVVDLLDHTAVERREHP